MENLFWSHVIFAIIIGVVGIFAAGIVSWIIVISRFNVWEHDFDGFISIISTEIAISISEIETEMDSLAQSIVMLQPNFDGSVSSSISAAQFGALCFPLLSGNPVISYLEFSPRVGRLEHRLEWEALMSIRGNRSIRVRDYTPQGHKPREANASGTMFPIAFVEPWSPTDNIVGFNIQSANIKFRQLNASAQSGRVASSKLVLLRRSGSGLLFDKIIFDITKNRMLLDFTSPLVHGNLIAVVEVDKRLSVLFRDVLAQHPTDRVRIWMDLEEDQLIFDSHPGEPRRVHDSEFEQTKYFRIASTTWRAEFTQMFPPETFWKPMWVVPLVLVGFTLGGICLYWQRSTTIRKTVSDMNEAILESARQSHEKILHYLCHEMRNPLHMCIGCLHEVISGIHSRASPRQVAEDARNALTSAQHMFRVVEDAKQMRSQNDVSATPTIIPTRVRNPDAMLHNLGMNYRLIVRPQVDLVVQQENELPSRMHVDIVRLSQVLGNGIHNASKHTNSGSIVIHGEFLPHAPELGMESPWVLCAIVNTSNASLPDDINDVHGRLLQTYYSSFPHLLPYMQRCVREACDAQRPRHKRLLVQTTRRARSAIAKQVQETLTARGSTGFGLPVCRSIIEAMGGMIGLHHDDARNATIFWVAVPVDRPTDGEFKLERCASSLESLHSGIAEAHILLVDDAPIAVRLMERAVKKVAGASNMSAHNGEVACDLFRRENIIGVVMDVTMPGMSGIEACKSMRECGRNSGVPIVLVTGHDDERTRQLAMEAGASDVLVKPVKKSQFVSLFQAWVATEKT